MTFFVNNYWHYPTLPLSKDACWKRISLFPERSGLEDQDFVSHGQIFVQAATPVNHRADDYDGEISSPRLTPRGEDPVFLI